MRPSRPREIRLTTGYFDCRKRIARLKRFQNLIRHRERWGFQIDLAPPLETLIPELRRAVPDDERSGLMPNLTQEQVRAMREPVLIDREINRLIPMVRAYLNAVDIGTGFTFSSREREFDAQHGQMVDREKEQNFDIVSDYFVLPPNQGRTFETLMGVIERGIGVYEARQRIARLEWFNPLIWIAAVLRTPLYVLERAGFDESPSAVQSAVFQIYTWLVRLVVILILVLAAAKLGISIPWREIWKSAFSMG